MASLVQKTVKGYKYWYIVESQRINGKPRPVVLEYLGTANRLLKRLNQSSKGMELKSYCFGDVAALLSIAQRLDIVQKINKYIKSNRKGVSKKPIRNNLTAGATFLLAAIGRSCKMTSKRGWYDWAKTTSLEYLLSSRFSKINSQHFWDLMDALPAKNIEKVEAEILKEVKKVYKIQTDTLFYDTTNFYTFICTTNEKNTIAQRGKNKQKRNDLRQVGMALVVNKADQIPLFHYTYEGNLHDSKVFEKVIGKIVGRMESLGLDKSRHTMVLDRGNNSKANLKILKRLNLFYVGGLSPSHHKSLSSNALQVLGGRAIGKDEANFHTLKTPIWEEDVTLVFFISETLRQGQIRGLYKDLTKVEKQLSQLKDKLIAPKSRKRNRKQILEQIGSILKSKRIEGLFTWRVKWKSKGRYELSFERDKTQINALKQGYGLRILMTNRHQWSGKQIIQAYYGQANVEKAFKELKNPYHLSLRPQYHWTDQKIRVHHFICVLAYLLSTLLMREMRKKLSYTASINTLLNELKNIRLVSIIENKEDNQKMKIRYDIEQMTDQEKVLFEALNLKNILENKVKIKGVSIYN